MVTLREYYQKKRDFYGIDQLGILVIAYKFGLLVECLASKPARLRELREPFSMPAGPCFWLGTAIAIVGGGIALASYLWKPLCERRFMRDSVGRQTRRPCGVGRVEDEQASLAAVVLICWCRFWRLQRFSPSKYRPELADSRFGWGVRRAQVRGAFDGPVVHLVLGAN